MLLPSEPFGRQEAGPLGPRYRLVLPSLAAQGESFTGMVVEETDSGASPLGEGNQLIVSGKVIPVQKDGSVEVPAFVTEIGNVFVAAEILHATTAGPVNRYPVAEHVEIVPVQAALPTKIAWASTIVPGAGTIRVVGVRLDALREAALARGDGTLVALRASTGSSLERFYPLPAGGDLAGAAYRFVGLDADGRRHEAPNQTHVPRITVRGTPILNRGQQGKVTVSVQAGVPVTIEFRGGLPQVDLKEHVVRVPPNGSREVDFVARELGQYHLVARLVSREDPVAATDATRVDAKAEPPTARYDPRRDITSVTSRFRLLDNQGRPVRGTSVDVALSHPRGIEFTRVAIDNRGMASVVSELAGRVAPAEVSAHLYRVLDRSWKESPTGSSVLVAEGCVVSAKWHAGPPIKVTSELSYSPTDAQILSDMRPGDLIGLSLLAEDDDILVQECRCHGDADVRRHEPTPDRVRYDWTLDGPGRLIHPGGSTTNSILYQVPFCFENPSQLRPARINVRLSNGPFKADDEAIDRSLVFQPSIDRSPGPRGTQIQRVVMAVASERPRPPPAEERLQDQAGPDCVFDTPAWTTGDKLTGDPNGLGRAFDPEGWPNNLIVVRADYWDNDDLTIKCKGRTCGPASERMPQIYDDVQYDWSFTRGGGEFALGSRGSAVIVQPPFLRQGELQVQVTDSGRQGRDTPPVTKKITIPVRKKPLALVALGDIEELRMPKSNLKQAAKEAAAKYADAGYEVDYVDKLTWAKMQQVVQNPRFQAILIIAHGGLGTIFLTDVVNGRESMEPADLEGWVREKWQCPRQPFIRELILLACDGGQEQWARPFFSLQTLATADRWIRADRLRNEPLEFVRDDFTPLPPRIPR